MSFPVVRLENVSKRYQLGTIGYGSLQQDLASWFARLRGKDDPNAAVDRSSRPKKNADFWALRNINFEVQQGDRVGIVGRNGAGKSTLLKVLSRITSPTEGVLRTRGRIASLLEVGTGFHPELTGRENVFLNGAILGMKRREILGRFDEIVAFSGVQNFIDTPVKRYSSGMYVRLAFSVAAHLDSEILIVDEVLAVGDAEFQKKCIGKLESISNGQGRTILFVSHNLNAVKSLCNRGLLLQAGSMVAEGEIGPVLNSYLDSGTQRLHYGSCVFEPDPALEFQVSSVRLTDFDGNQVTTVETDSDFALEIACTSRVPLEDLYGYLAVSNDEFQTVIECDSREGGENPFNTLVSGEHVVRLTFPRRLLGVGNYTVYLNFTARYRSGNVHSPGDTIRFSVVDTHTARGNDRGAILATVLPWQKLRS